MFNRQIVLMGIALASVCYGQESSPASSPSFRVISDGMIQDFDPGCFVPPGCITHSVRTQGEQSTQGQKVASDRRNNSETRARFYTQASFLYWKTNVNGLAYAVEASPSSTAPGRGSIHTPAFEWGPGFNVGLGYQIPHDSWKIDLQATLYKTHCTTLLHPEEDQVLFPVWTAPSGVAPGIFMQMSQHYRLHLGFIDLLLSKQLALTSRITVSPFLGICYFSVRQKYHLDCSIPDDPILWSMKNKFWGVGPNMGCSGDLSLFKGFSLFGNVAIKLPYGKFYTHQEEKLEKTNAKRLKLFDRFCSIAPVTACTLGLRFQTPVSNRNQQWTVEIGYDQMLLFAQNQLPHFAQSSSPGLIVGNGGDISLMGAHLTAGFAF